MQTKKQNPYLKFLTFIIGCVIILTVFSFLFFGFYNVSYTKSVTVKQHEATISSYDFLKEKDFHYYPLKDKEGKYIKEKCDYIEDCYVLYASKKQPSFIDEKTEKADYEISQRAKLNPSSVVITGYSVGIADLRNWKTFTLSGNKGISLFEGKY